MLTFRRVGPRGDLAGHAGAVRGRTVHAVEREAARERTVLQGPPTRREDTARTAGEVHQAQCDAGTGGRIVPAEHVAEYVVELGLGVDPDGDGERLFSQRERVGGGYLQPGVDAVEDGALRPVELDTVVDRVMVAAGIVVAVAVEFPVPDQPVLRRRGRSVLGLLTPPFPESGIQSLEKAE